jgi:hypothetical protein
VSVEVLTETKVPGRYTMLTNAMVFIQALSACKTRLNPCVFSVSLAPFRFSYSAAKKGTVPS